MIIENTGLKGLRTDLAHLDEVANSLGFIRWQWEYYRATYDLKLQDQATGTDFFLRFNTRAESGKLENPETILRLDDVYIGKATFPHGLDYSVPIPESIMNTVQQKVIELKQALSE